MKKQYFVELIEKSLNGNLIKEEAVKLIPMLESEIKFIKDNFDDGIYEVTIKNTTSSITGVLSKTLDVLCRKYKGMYQNIRTFEVYCDSMVIFSKKIN